MAITDFSGLTINAPQVGIQISKVTDSSADWSGVLNSTYFYDKTDKLVHYKDSTGAILEIFSSTTTAGGLKHGVATGTNTYAVTITGVTSYTDGDAYLIRFTNGSAANSTININSLGVKTLTKKANVQVTGGDIVAGQEMLIIYDGTNFQCIQTTANQLFAYVTNDDSVTITAGQPVYAFGAAGNRMSVKLAANTADATSAQTVGVVFSSSIAANQRGFIITQGVIDGLDTSMYNPGDQLYLGNTAGSLTSIKPFAPNHLVYIGIVERANAGNGQIYVKPQNGYELDELHDVNLITTPPQNGDVLTYDAVNDLWVPAPIPGVSNVGNQLLSGGASWSGTGMVFNVSKLSYLIDTTPYTSAPQNVTLSVGDPTNPRFDAIVVDAAGVVSVIPGTPAANPLVPSIPGTQVLVQYVLVGTNATTPSVTNEFVYREGSSPDWNTSSVAGTAPLLSVDFSSTVLPPFLGTQSTLVTAPSFVNTNPPTKYIQYAKPVGNISRSAFPFFSFRVRLPASLPARNIQVVLYNNTTIIGSVLATNWGMNMTSINNWQLVSIPTSAFGNLGITTITSVRFFMTGVAANTFAAGFDRYGLDDIKFQSGYGPQTNTATIEVLDSGVTVGSTAKLNFIDGTNTTAVATQDVPNNKIDVRINTTGLVPYTGAAADINLGAQMLTGSLINGTSLRVLPTYTSDWVSAFTFTGNGVNAQGNIILREWSTGAGKIHSIGLISGLVYAASRTITFPDANGTLVTRVNGVSANNNGVVTIPEAIQVAASDETSNLTTGTAKITFRMPYALTLTAVRASLSTAQTSGTLVTVDINLNGTSILGTKLTFENGQKTTTTATTPATITTSALTDDGEITIDVDAIGLAGAKGLKITLIGTRV